MTRREWILQKHPEWGEPVGCPDMYGLADESRYECIAKGCKQCWDEELNCNLCRYQGLEGDKDPCMECTTGKGYIIDHHMFEAKMVTPKIVSATDYFKGRKLGGYYFEPVKPREKNRDDCIEEMIDIFGIKAVMDFCLCTMWESRYMAADEAADKKSKYYKEKYLELKERR